MTVTPVPSRPGRAGATTRRRGLDRAETATTALAVVLSSTGYVLGGSPYLARGVVGDLVGLALLTAVLLRTGRRLRHEALLCLLLIGAVLLAAPAWPLRVPEAAWWAVWSAALTGYLLLRQPRTRSAS